MNKATYEEIEAPLYCLIGDGEGGTEAAAYQVGEYLVIVPEEGGPVTYRKPCGYQIAAPNAQLLETAKEALDHLTDHGIDLDGEEEECVAGIRLRLDEAISAASGS